MAYGIEVFNSSGTKVLELSNRVARFVQTGNGQAVNASSSVNISVTGMQNNDSWDVIVMSETSGFITFTISKNTGYFTVTNNSGLNTTISYWVLRT